MRDGLCLTLDKRVVNSPVATPRTPARAANRAELLRRAARDLILDQRKIRKLNPQMTVPRGRSRRRRHAILRGFRITVATVLSHTHRIPIRFREICGKNTSDHIVWREVCLIRNFLSFRSSNQLLSKFVPGIGAIWKADLIFSD